MSESELLAKIQVLEKEVQRLKDIDEIKYLQRAYGFYLENWMAEDLIDLFIDSDDCYLFIAAGQFFGKENIRIFFHQAVKMISIYCTPAIGQSSIKVICDANGECWFNQRV